MATIHLNNKSETQITIYVTGMNLTYPEKRLTFFIDGTEDDSNTIEIPSASYEYYYTYYGLSPGTEYELSVEVEEFIPGLGYDLEDTLYLDVTTSGGSMVTPTYTITNTSDSVTFHVQNRDGHYMRFYVRYDGGSGSVVYDSEDEEGGYVAVSTYTVTDLDPNTDYAVNVYYASSRSGYDSVAIGRQYFTTDSGGSSSVSLWDWDASNGSATAAQTRNAYSAITNQGNLSDFSYKVWNDLCSKVNDAVTAKGYSWSSSSGYLTYNNTLMTTNDKELTAERFNTLRYQIGRFISTTGITNRRRGDIVYGWYFVDLADYLNDLINSI